MSIARTNQITGQSTLTLGELLYAHPTIALISEKQWVAAVRAIAAGDKAALRVLYERTFPIVSTYLRRLTVDRYVTDTLILEVFETIWCEAPLFNTADGPVLGWIMRHARSRVLSQERLEGSYPDDPSQIAVRTPADPGLNGGGVNGEVLQLQGALAELTVDERQALDALFLDGLSYAEFAERIGQPTGTIKNRIRSGLAKLQKVLQAQGEDK